MGWGRNGIERERTRQCSWWYILTPKFCVYGPLCFPGGSAYFSAYSMAMYPWASEMLDRSIRYIIEVDLTTKPGY
jgi:hypothetical protein